ncbi:MAG: helix-turn-helix domain-containing protein [Syntrophobacteraceae bacterium]
MSDLINIQKRFGQRMRALRVAKGLSQEEFAANCGLDRTYISGVERGRRNISLKNIEVVAQSLGVKISEFFEE